MMTKEQLFTQLFENLTDSGLFFGHGVIDAQDEAMMVMMHVFKQTVDEILCSGQIKVDMQTIKKAEKIVSQRLNTLKPMAYIVGEVQFAGLTFKSDKRALVPRSPIAELIGNDFQPWLNLNTINKALDLCTGSGCIGIALAKYNPHIQVDISDLSKDALSLAKTNIELHDLNQQVNAVQSDLFAELTGPYDLIVSNPPYVSENEYSQLPQEYKKEPKLGLTTPQEGLQIPVKIMLDAPEYLNENGLLFLEVGYTDELLEDTFPAVDFEWIDFENGGHGVCVLSKHQLLTFSKDFKNFLMP